MKQSYRWLRALALTLAMVSAASPAATAAPIYTVSYDGVGIDLSGSIEISVTGVFSPAAFNAQVIDYSITASENGLGPFTFTTANSTWGAFGGGAFVTITVTASQILLSAPTGSIVNSGNLFLATDATTGGGCCIPNLALFDDILKYRTPENVPGSSVFELGAPRPFELASDSTAVPEPGTLALVSLAAGAVLTSRTRRRLQRRPRNTT